MKRGARMEILIKINNWLGSFDNIVGSLGLIVAIIGVIVGFIGKKEIKEANELKVQFRDLEAKVEKIEISNSQIAQTINNNGINLQDADFLVNKVVDEKTKNKPDVLNSKYEPEVGKQKPGDYWEQDY